MATNAAQITAQAGVRLLLVVCDDRAHRPLRRILARCGYSVDCAVSGEDALALLATEGYAAVVSELSLPGEVSGLAIMRELQAMGRRLPIVLLAEGDVTKVEAAIQSSPEATCLQVPLDVDRLKRVVAAHCLR